MGVPDFFRMARGVERVAVKDKTPNRKPSGSGRLGSDPSAHGFSGGHDESRAVLGMIRQKSKSRLPGGLQDLRLVRGLFVPHPYTGS